MIGNARNLVLVHFVFGRRQLIGDEVITSTRDGIVKISVANYYWSK